NPPC
ncbi:von Willebrand factor type A domain protein, partial [Vibrio parahaemolyticus V-223/04]